MLVAGALSHNVFRITPSGTIIEIIDQNGDGEGHKLLEPSYIVEGSRGRFYVTGSTSHNAFEVVSNSALPSLAAPGLAALALVLGALGSRRARCRPAEPPHRLAADRRRRA